MRMSERLDRSSWWTERWTRDFPPPSVAKQHYGKIHELSLSLVITGDDRVRNWTCAVICELFDEQNMAEYARQAAEIMQMFIHQQYTARALIFLMLLGYMCEELAAETETFMETLNPILKQDVSGHCSTA